MRRHWLGGPPFQDMATKSCLLHGYSRYHVLSNGVDVAFADIAFDSRLKVLIQHWQLWVKDMVQPLGLKDMVR